MFFIISLPDANQLANMDYEAWLHERSRLKSLMSICVQAMVSLACFNQLLCIELYPFTGGDEFMPLRVALLGGVITGFSRAVLEWNSMGAGEGAGERLGTRNRPREFMWMELTE